MISCKKIIYPLNILLKFYASKVARRCWGQITYLDLVHGDSTRICIRSGSWGQDEGQSVGQKIKGKPKPKPKYKGKGKQTISKNNYKPKKYKLC